MSDSSDGNRDLLSDLDLARSLPSQGTERTQYAADLSELDPYFTSPTNALQSPLISFSTTSSKDTPFTPTKDLQEQIGNLMMSSPAPSNLQPALIDFGTDHTDPYAGYQTATSSTTDMNPSETFDTPPSSPVNSLQTFTPVEISSPNPPLPESPGVPHPSDHSSFPKETSSVSDTPSLSERFDTSNQTNYFTDPVPHNDKVEQEFPVPVPNNKNTYTECSASPPRISPASDSCTSGAISRTVSADGTHTGSMLLIQGMADSITLEKLKLHFNAYRSCIHVVDLVPDPMNNALQLGVVKFYRAELARNLLKEFQQLPLSGCTHKLIAESCEIPLPPLPQDAGDPMDELENRSSVMEGAPIVRERRTRPVSPASLEFSPCEGARSDPQRVPNRCTGRFPSKFPRIESQTQSGEAPVHAVMIKNILKTQNFRKLQAYVENWWGGQIHSIKPVPDKNSSQHIILYINVYGEKLPDVIASKLREAQYVFQPMVIEIKYYTPLSGSAKGPVKPKCQKEIFPENNFSTRAANSPHFHIPPYDQEEYPQMDPGPPPKDCTPSAPPYHVEDSPPTTLVLDQVLGDVTEELMKDYFTDFLEFAISWEAYPDGEGFTRVEVVFSSKRAALQAMRSLEQFPLNGRNVLFSIEQASPKSDPPPIRTEDPLAYLIITGVGNDVTIVEFENDTILKRYKDFYSDLRVQTNSNTGDKRLRVSFHNRDVIIEAESSLLQNSFRGKKFDVRIEHITPKEQTTPKQEHRPLPTLKGSPSNECKVVVRKIPPDTKEFEVFELFNQYGNIIKDIELKRMSQTSTLLQCNIVFENSVSAYRAARDQINCKGNILDVKLLSELIQIESTEIESTEMESTEMESTEVEVSMQTEEKSTEQIPQATASRNISAELMLFIRTKFKSHFDNFKPQGTVTYDEKLGILTVSHPDNREFLRFEKDVLDEIDEVITNLDGEGMKLLNSPIQNYLSCIDMICGVLRDTKQIDYMMNHYPDQIHIFGDKLAVSVTVKKLREALYSQLLITCPLVFFFKSFPSILHPNINQFHISDLTVTIKGTSSVEQCKEIRDSMLHVVSSCCVKPLNMSQKLLKPAHVFITRNDLCVCLLIQTQDGEFLDKAEKSIPGGNIYVCGLKEHIDPLIPVLENPIEERVSISQKALKKFTKSTDKGTILLEKFKAKSKVSISLEKQTVIITGFIHDDINAMVEELKKKLEDVNIVLDERYLESLQKSYLLTGQAKDQNLISQIIQDLECRIQLSVKIQNDQIVLSGDQDSLHSCEASPRELVEFFRLRIPIKTFHKVVEETSAEIFMKLIYRYLTDLSIQENFFIFIINKPQPMKNRPGSSDIQILITADVSTIVLIEPKVKEIRPKCENVKLRREDLNLILTAASGKIERIQASEYLHIIPDRQECKLQVFSIGLSSRTAQNMVDFALSDESDSRELPITQMLAFFIREKNLINILTDKWQCNMKIIEVKENEQFITRFRIDGRREPLEKVANHITTMNKELTYKSVEIKFPSKKFCSQFHAEILEILTTIKGDSNIVIDARSIAAGKDSTSIGQAKVNFISNFSSEVDRLSGTFSNLIKFSETTPVPLLPAQHAKLASDMLPTLTNQSLERHYYIVLSRENVFIKALNHFAKTSLSCGQQDIQPYLEISSCEYRPDNFVIFNLLNNQPSQLKLNALGVENSVNIKPPASLEQPFKLEGKHTNVQTVLAEIKKYVQELWQYLGTCEVSVHCPLSVIQADTEIIKFLSGLSHPSINIQYEFPSQSQIIVGEELIASYEVALNTHILSIDLRKGDITKLKVDAIVNAANDNLDHCGGVALAISDAGGPIVQQSSTEHVKRHGKVSVSQNVMLPPGNLPCQFVIHAVGPIWDSMNPNKVKNELGQCVFNICQQADGANLSSIAIPTISAGIYGFPLQLSTSIIIEAIDHFFSIQPNYSIRKLILIDIQNEALSQFQKICNQKDKFRRCPIPHPLLPLQKKAVSSAPQILFEWQENDGTWCSYSETDHNNIRTAYKANPKGTAKTSRNKYTYTIDFVSMVQTNDQTQAQRNIRITNLAPATESVPMSASPPASWKEISSEKVRFFGPIDTLDSIKQQFTILTQKLVAKTEFPVTCQIKDLIRIVDSCKTEYAKFDLTKSDDGNSKVLIEGFAREVMESERNITAELLKLLMVQDPQFAPTPKHWDPHSANEMCRLVSLQPTSPEYLEVVNKFQSTLPTAAVVRIERIQNTWLWTRYQQDKQRIVHKSTTGANELILYHGTRNTDPMSVYKGAQGFDFRFSRSGMWGNANYFAVNASYSHSYAHTLGDGSKQMFSVRICAGDVIDLAPDGKLRLPPPKPQTTSLDQSTQLGFRLPMAPTPQAAVAPQFANDPYDTVSGDTGGSKVYMIYENGRAYPEYLITYR